MSAENPDELVNSEASAVAADQTVEMYELGGAGGEAEDAADSEQPDWSTLTVAALKAELSERGLVTTGRKAELVARLEASLSGIECIEPETQNTLNDTETETDTEPVTSQATPAEEREEPDEGDDEIPEGDEFVEWNEDADHEGAPDEAKVTDESVKAVESVDDLKPESDEHKEGEEAKTSELKEDVLIEEGDVKTEEGELSVDVHREKDLFYLTWHGKKITVPFKGEIMKDMLALSKLQTIIIYPITLPDIYNEELRKYMEQATGVDMELEDTLPGKPPKGLLKLKFSTYTEAQQATEALKTLKEGIVIKQYSKDVVESHIMNTLRKEDCERKGPIIFRLVYVGNLPADATEATLRENFPDALQVIIPYDEDTHERLGYAYLEYADEKIAYEMSEKYKEHEINGEKLYVIPAISEKKEKYGLLRDSLRLCWSEEVYRHRKVLEKPHNRKNWEISHSEGKVTQLTRRLEKDDRRREILRLPRPDYIADKEKKEKEGEAAKEKTEDGKEKGAKKESRSKSREKRSSHQRSTSRRSPRRSPPQQRREYRPTQRGQQNFQSRREDVADKLVNQLQGLVSALTHKLPTVEPPRPLLEDFGPLANLLEQQRHLSSSAFSGSTFRGQTAYGGNSYGDTQGSSRYTSGAKRYHDGDDYGGDRKRRMSDYDNSGSSSGRYGSSSTTRGGRGGQSYNNDDRYGSRRDNNTGSTARPYTGPSKWH